jgi:8-oxo-dGTP diphosphatase
MTRQDVKSPEPGNRAIGQSGTLACGVSGSPVALLALPGREAGRLAKNSLTRCHALISVIDRIMITVTAGILTCGEHVLVCQRRAGGRFPLKWEFPGGKLEEGETAEGCLQRELREELSVEAEVGPEIYRTEHRYPGGFGVRLLFFRIRRFTGTPVNLAFERIEWARVADLSRYDFLEADRELVDRMARGEIG